MKRAVIGGFFALIGSRFLLAALYGFLEDALPLLLVGLVMTVFGLGVMICEFFNRYD